jgi:hypothetical protein
VFDISKGAANMLQANGKDEKSDSPRRSSRATTQTDFYHASTHSRGTLRSHTQPSIAIAATNTQSEAKAISPNHASNLCNLNDLFGISNFMPATASTQTNHNQNMADEEKAVPQHVLSDNTSLFQAIMARVVARHVVETQTAEQILNMELPQDAPLGNEGDDEEGAFPEPSAGVPPPPPFFTTLASPTLPQPSTLATPEHKTNQNMHAQGSCYDPFLIEDSENEGEAVNEGNENEAEEDNREPLPEHQPEQLPADRDASGVTIFVNEDEMESINEDTSGSNDWEVASDDFSDSPILRRKASTHPFVEAEESKEKRKRHSQAQQDKLADANCSNDHEDDSDNKEEHEQLHETKTLQSQDQKDKQHIAQRLKSARDVNEANGVVSSDREEILNPDLAYLKATAQVVKRKQKLRDALAKLARVRSGPARMGPTPAPRGLEVEPVAVCHTSLTDLLELQDHIEIIEESSEYLSNTARTMLCLSSKFRKAARHTEEVRSGLMRKAISKANIDANKNRDIYTNAIINAYGGNALQGYALRDGQNAQTVVYVIKRTDGPVFHHKKCCKPNEEWERCKKKWIKVQRNGKKIYDTAKLHFRDKWRAIPLQDALDLGKRECTDNCCKNIGRNSVELPPKKKRKAKK